MKGGWLIVALAVLMLGGCRPDEDQAHEVSGEAVPARPGPTRPPGAHMEGNYVLTGVNGAGLPAVLDQDERCHTEVVDASLRVEAGRFAFQNRVREVCPPQGPGELVMHAGGGTVTLDGDQVVLVSDVGQAFSEARGTADETGITIRQLSTDAGAVSVTWRFERRGPELVPVPGAEDRATGPDNP
jgi:hypothetical protein